MARKNGPPPEDVEFSSEIGAKRPGMDFYTGREFDEGETFDSTRAGDDPEQGSQFLRAQKRVPVRRGPIPKKAANWLWIALQSTAVILFVGVVTFGSYYYLANAPRFRVESSDAIQVSGNKNVSRDEALEVFGDSIARNIFRAPLDELKQNVEKISWVESATVMRYLPNRLAVEIKERTPVAFVQLDTRIALIDANGVVMNPPLENKYSFPVLSGFSEIEPLSTRAARMKIYNALIKDLDSGGKNYSQDISDVDLTNPEDIRMAVADGTAVIHATSKRGFLEQYERYLAYAPQCRARVGTSSVDIDARLSGQVPCRPLINSEQVADEKQAKVEPQPPPPLTTKPKKPTTKPAAAKAKNSKHR